MSVLPLPETRSGLTLPEIDTALLQSGTPEIGPAYSTYTDPQFGIPNSEAQPEVDTTLLPGVPNQSPIFFVTSPVVNTGSANYANIGLDYTAVVINGGTA